MNLRSPLGFSPATAKPFKASQGTAELNKFASPFLSFNSRTTASLNTFNDSISNFRKELRLNVNSTKNQDSKDWESNRWKGFGQASPKRSPRRGSFSPKRLQGFTFNNNSGDPLTKIKSARQGGLQFNDIGTKVADRKNTSLLSSQLKIEQVFRNGSPRGQPKQMAFISNKVPDPNPWAKPKSFVSDVNKNRVRDRTVNPQRFRSQETEFDLDIRIQRNSLEKKLKGDRSWLNDFNINPSSTRQPTPRGILNKLNSDVRAESKLPIQDVMKLNTRLGELKSNDYAKLSSNSVSELSTLSDTLSRIIREANKRR